jgi:hypothetical protein
MQELEFRMTLLTPAFTIISKNRFTQTHPGLFSDREGTT